MSMNSDQCRECGLLASSIPATNFHGGAWLVRAVDGNWVKLISANQLYVNRCTVEEFNRIVIAANEPTAHPECPAIAGTRTGGMG